MKRRRTNQGEEKEKAALYSLGLLGEAEAGDFERELTLGIEPAGQSLRIYEEMLSNLAFAAPAGVAPSPSVRSALLERIASIPQIKNPRREELEALSRQVRNLPADESVWRTVYGGVRIKTLAVDNDRGTVALLVRIEPGGRIPPHQPTGAEDSLVLEGDCRVNGLILRPGDYRSAPEGSIDGEVTTQKGTLFLMIAPRKFEILDVAE
jgi:anti-sigma-K factor RskA